MNILITDHVRSDVVQGNVFTGVFDFAGEREGGG